MLHKALYEVSVTFFGMFAICFLLSLISYSPDDAAWSFSSTESQVDNYIGILGAWVADLALHIFGWGAFFLAVYFLGISVHLIFVRLEDISVPWLLYRFVGHISFPIGLCSLLALFANDNLVASFPNLPAGSGGILGSSLVAVGVPVLNVVGLTLIATGLFLLSLSAAFGTSLFDVSSEIYKALCLCLSFLGSASKYLLEKLFLHMSLFYERLTRPDVLPKIKEEKVALKKLSVRNADVTDADEMADIDHVVAKEEKKSQVRSSKKSFFSEATESLGLRQALKPTSVETIGLVKHYLPKLGLLDDAERKKKSEQSQEQLKQVAKTLEERFREFNIEVQVVGVLPGPVVTRYELELAPGVKVASINALVKDIARSLAVVSVRIVEVIPNKPFVGIEIPNKHRKTVRLKTIFSSSVYRESNSPVTLALGHDISGSSVVADIAKMPHLLVAGTTGSGKSVGLNAMLLSLLFKATPEEVRLILIDPKMLELAVYDGIPHLLTPVVTDMNDAAEALQWCIVEMEQRYRLMADLGVRNVNGYNKKVREAFKRGEQPTYRRSSKRGSDSEEDTEGEPLTVLPLIVVVIDEFADMMMVVGKKVEQLIARLAQKARAAGIHLILATQRPSVDVITGLIKANIPSRIAFQVSSKVDSRTIMDQMGAEQLLGHGDMLYLPPGVSIPVRVHGAYVSDDEVHRVVSDWKAKGEPEYIEMNVSERSQELDIAGDLLGSPSGDSNQDAFYDEAVTFVMSQNKVSISSIQRKFRIGYNRAARIVETMEESGIVSPMNSNGSREIIRKELET